MWFLIYAEDVADSETLRAPLRPVHIARREALFEQGRILASGPLSGQPGKPYSGSLLLAKFDSLDEARAWAEADPYAVAGIYRQLIVKHFNRHFPRPQAGQVTAE
jgi:uncharacterized protein